MVNATDGLLQELYKKVYQFNKPCDYEEWKNATMCRQEQYIHMKAKLDLHRPKNPMPQQIPTRGGWVPSRNIIPHFTCDPNAMDTSTDRTRACLANAEYVLAKDQQQNTHPLFPPRGGAMGVRRGP